MKPMARLLIRVALVAFVTLGSLASGSAQGPAIDKAYMGRWKLNAEKSKWVSGTMPKELIRTHEDRGNGFVIVWQDQVNAQGVKTRTGYTYRPDGKPYPWAQMNATKLQTISLTTTDPMTVDFRIFQDGVLTSTGHRVIAKDGKSMVITGADADGQPGNTQVFDRIQ
ncbi:MAG TPA: hypothetical protein VM032_07290 [Vicinamibacterales bacterium]|nr:hypothetical protein [Vicinamibacterales bacterium]